MARDTYIKTVEEGQDIYDLCIQEYGSINAVFLLLRDNPQVDFIRKLIAGEKLVFRLNVPDEVPLDKNVLAYFRTQQIRVNSNEQELLQEDDTLVTTTGNTITTAQGNSIGISNYQVYLPAPITLSGITTSQGNVLVTSSNQLILPQ